MINYDSILSAFDGKPTLLQWLKMVKKALDESILKDVTIQKDGDNIAFTFNFEDGTSVTTPYIEIHNGVDGVSITSIYAVGNEVVGDETLTTLRANYSNNTTGDFVVTAKNGKDGIGTLYFHLVKISDSTGAKNVYFTVYSTKENLNLEDALQFIPVNASANLTTANKITACFDDGSNFNTVAQMGRFHGAVGNPLISVNYNGTLISFEPSKIVDSKLGANL